jgi:hypothetical protein
MYLWTCGRFKSANHKKIGSANRESPKCHTSGRPANLTNYLSTQFCGICDLRNLFADPPPLQISNGFASSPSSSSDLVIIFYRQLQLEAHVASKLSKKIASTSSSLPFPGPSPLPPHPHPPNTHTEKLKNLFPSHFIKDPLRLFLSRPPICSPTAKSMMIPWHRRR